MTLIEHADLYLDGVWTKPETGDLIEVVSATTESIIGTVPEASTADVDRAVAAARTAFDAPGGWPSWKPEDRAAVMERFADALEARAGETARLVSSQNGMPLSVSTAIEGTFPALLLRYYAGLIRTNPLEELRPGMGGASTIVMRQPIGVVGAIVPWNVPQAITFLKVAPALAAGCTVVVKPSPETVLDAYVMAEAAIEAGLPPGVLNIVPGGRELGAYLVSHPHIDKVSFTGSTAAGRSIAETCGRLLRPVTLELGGKSAAIVLDDADLADNIESFFASTLLNNGQICWLGTRVLAPRSRYAEVLDTITDMVAGLKVGDALDVATQVGPLASARQRERVEGYIAKGTAQGARITVGGGRPDQDTGWFVQPTVFADVDNAHTIAREEIFGPVLSVIPYGDENEAIAMANDNDFGLGGSVWTSDAERGEAVARRVRTGTIGINSYVSDPTAPFGGVKGSGMGREMGPEGLTAFQEIKSIYLEAPPLV
jgi:aldehyde dehydrogenase (NAD+)